jgi:hypothetical protein
MSDHPWVDASWDVIEPGDEVQAPDGTAWVVIAKVDVSVPGDPYIPFLIAPVSDLSAEVWTDRERGTRVQAWRFREARPLPNQEGLAIGALRLGGFDVDVIGGA